MGTTHTTQPVPTPATLLTSPSAFATVELAERISKIAGIRYSSQQGAWNDSGCSEYEEKLTFQISKRRDECIWTVRLINGKVQEWVRLAIWDGFIEDVQWNKGEYAPDAETGLMRDMEAVSDEFTVND